MNLESDTAIDTPSDSGEGDGFFDLGESMADLVKARGDKLGDGNEPEEEPDPAPEADPAPKPPVAPTPPGNGAPPAPEPPPGQRRPPDLERAPPSWKPEVAALWTGLSPEIRAEIHRREEDSARGVAEVKSIADLGRKFQSALTPFQAELTHYGIDPVAHMTQLMQAHRTLALGTPSQKQEMFARLAREYNITPAPAVPASEPGWVDPQVQALQEKMDRLESQSTRTQQQLAADRQAKLTQEITAFATDAANPHFDAVAMDVAQLIEASKGTLSLRDAYDKAVWMNPDIREQMVKAQTAKAAEDQRLADEKRAAESARFNGLKIKSRSKNVSATGATGSIDDTLKETFKAIQARG